MRYLIDSIHDVDLFSFGIGYIFSMVILSLYLLGEQIYLLVKERKGNIHGKSDNETK